MIASSDDGNDELSLIANSVQRTPVSREEFELKLGVPIFRTTAETTDENTATVYRFPGNLSKICLETSHKKNLHASIRKWIEKWGRKQSIGVKFLSHAAAECSRTLLDEYVRKVGGSREVRADDNDNDNSQEEGKLMGCALLATGRSPTHSLALYHPRPRGILFEGEIRSATSSVDPPQTTAILKCAASLYYQLWYFRTIQAKDVFKAYGFSVTTTGAAAIWVTLLLLEKPPTGPIGGRYSLYEYTKRYELPAANKTNNNDNTVATLDDLGHFLLSQTLPCPFLDAANLSNTHAASPGFMLLPYQHHQASSCLSGSAWHVIPTITGSLVIRCHGANAVVRLLQLGEDEESDMANLATEFYKVAKETTSDESTTSTTNVDVWYVKYKTPPFGHFWDTARIAINGTRSLLLRPSKARRIKDDHQTTEMLSTTRRLAVQDWLRMYPIDSHVTKSRSITIMRSVGSTFTGQKQLSWKDFKFEFASLMKDTIHFQTLCNNLIHGDINEGNVLYDESAGVGSRLQMIDWDEALRGRPCHRQISTKEERLRYPLELVDFPEQYTKQQLLHLFKTLARKHYHHDGMEADENWKGDPLSSITSSHQDKNVNHQSHGFFTRTALDARFKTLLQFL